MQAVEMQAVLLCVANADAGRACDGLLEML